MVGSEPKLSLDEFSDILGRSKSTIYNAVKKLLDLGIIIYDIDDDVPSEGRYQHLYQFNKDFWESRLKKLETITIFKELLYDSAKHLRDHHSSDPRIKSLEELAFVYDWFEDRLPELFEELEVAKNERFSG